MAGVLEGKLDRRQVPRTADIALPTRLEKGGFDVRRALRQEPRRARIRCPHCLWQPERGSVWTCLPIGHPEYFLAACRHSWNTFDTRGLCPGCGHQWLHTSCLACGRWALHEAWYERDAGKPGASSWDR